MCPSLTVTALKRQPESNADGARWQRSANAGREVAQQSGTLLARDMDSEQAAVWRVAGWLLLPLRRQRTGSVLGNCPGISWCG